MASTTCNWYSSSQISLPMWYSFVVRQSKDIFLSAKTFDCIIIRSSFYCLQSFFSTNSINVLIGKGKPYHNLLGLKHKKKVQPKRLIH